MNIVTVTKEDFEADDILATLATQGAAAGLPRARRLGRPRHHPAGQRRRHAALPERARRLRAQALRPRRRARALRHRAAPVSRDRRARRRDQRQPDRHRQGRREDRRQVDQPVRQPRRDPRARRRDQGRRRREPARAEGQRDPQPPAQPPAHRRRASRRPGRPRAPARSTRPPCARSSTGCSSRPCSTGCSRSRQADGERRPACVADGAEHRGDGIPAVRTLVDEELAQLARPRRPPTGTTPLGLSVEIGRRQGRPASASRPHDDSAYVPWAAGPARLRARSRRGSRATRPSTCYDAKPQLKALRRAGLELDGIAFDTTLAGWLLQPGAQAADLADAGLLRTSARRCRRPTRTSSCPRPRRSARPPRPGTSLRLADVPRPNARRRVARGVSTTSSCRCVPVLADMELTGVTVNADVLARLSTRARREGRRLAAARLRRDRPRGEPRLAEAAARRCSSTSSACRRPARTRPATRRMPRRSPTCRSRTRIRSSTCCCSTATRRSSARSSRRSTRRSTPTAASTPPTSRPAPAPGRISSNDPNLQNIPVKTEVGREIRSAFERGEGFETLLTADYSQIEMRIMAHLSGDAGLIEAFNSGEDLHRFVGSRIFGVDAGRRHARHAHQGQGDVVRPRLRAQRLRPVEAAAHRDVRGQAAHDRLLRPLRRRARLPARRRRAGAASTATPRRSSAAAARSPTSRRPTGCCARTPSARRSTRRSRARPPTS